MLWRFNSELQLDRSAKKERKKEKCETLLGGRGCGTYFPHSLNFKTRSYAYNVLKKKKKPCILCRCRSFNSSLCRLSPFQLSFVAVSWPCHLSASVFCACPFLHIIVFGDGLNLRNFFNFKNQFSNKCSVFQLFTSGVGTSKRRCGACLSTASSKVWREIQKRVW